MLRSREGFVSRTIIVLIMAIRKIVSRNVMLCYLRSNNKRIKRPENWIIFLSQVPSFAIMRSLNNFPNVLLVLTILALLCTESESALMFHSRAWDLPVSIAPPPTKELPKNVERSVLPFGAWRFSMTWSQYLQDAAFQKKSLANWLKQRRRPIRLYFRQP